MEGLQTGLFLCDAGGVRTRSTEGGRSKRLGGCGNFSQLGLSLGDSQLDGWGGKDSRGSSPRFPSFGQGESIALERLHGPTWFP